MAYVRTKTPSPECSSTKIHCCQVAVPTCSARTTQIGTTGVGVAVGVTVGGCDTVGVWVFVREGVAVGVFVTVGLGVCVPVRVGVGEGVVVAVAVFDVEVEPDAEPLDDTDELDEVLPLSVV